MSKKVCIKGDGTEKTGKRIIEYLEGLGGVNKNGYYGDSKHKYYIDYNGCIRNNTPPSDYELITIPEQTPEKTFPREMWVWDDSRHNRQKEIVDGMYKDKYIARRKDEWFVFNYAKEIEPPKPLTTDEKIADLQRQIDELKQSMK